jgi:asparagine synthase (glutamine-hydrolysing)
MCGIAGSINHSLDIQQLTKDLRHRGPDEQNTLEVSNLQLHHHRLAILDIAGGKQPMHYEHLIIIYNGEIYNHQDIREKYGFKCTTNSDTETILHTYAKLGAECLHDFDGMFALVIYDKQKQQIFLARDRAGKKPLYYFSDGNKFVFASEIRALKNQLPLEINTAHIRQYIRMGYFYKSSTPYKNVFELPAGSYANVSIQKPEVKINKWWNIHHFYEQRSNDNFETAINKVDSILHEAIKNRVESSDLEVGSFLSGGIDSGIVTAIAKQYNASLKTFTVSFDGEYDEAPLAKLVADKYDTDHYEIKISFDSLVNDIEQILMNYGEPFFDSSAVPSFYVSQAAKKQLTVILNGDGGDELFAGYRRYVPFARYDFFKASGFARAMASFFHAIMPASNNKKSKYNYIYRLADLARKNKLGVYLSSTIDSFEGYEKKLLGNGSYLDAVNKDFDEINRSGLSGLKKIMNLDFDQILEANLLVKMDIATMTHSLEGRSPLLCKGLLEYVPSIGDSYKIKGTQTKYILRKLAEKYLPTALIYQPKRGFEIPLKKWIDGELKDLIAAYLFSADAYYSNFVDKPFVRNLWDRKIKTGDEKRAKMIWTLFALEVWYRRCYFER